MKLLCRSLFSQRVPPFHRSLLFIAAGALLAAVMALATLANADDFLLGGHYENGGTPEKLDAARGKVIVPPESSAAQAVMNSFNSPIYNVPYEVFTQLMANHDVWFVVPKNFTYEQADEFYSLAPKWKNLRLFPVEVPNSVDFTEWIRDYGPMFGKTDDGLAVLDTNYAADRPVDDSVPGVVARTLHLKYLSIPRYHEWGNFMIDENRLCAVSSHIFESAQSSGSHPWDMVAVLNDTFADLREIIGCTDVMTTTEISGESTGHIDIFAKFVGNNRVMIAQIEPEAIQRFVATSEQLVSRLRYILSHQQLSATRYQWIEVLPTLPRFYFDTGIQNTESESREMLVPENAVPPQLPAEAGNEALDPDANAAFLAKYEAAIMEIAAQLDANAESFRRKGYLVTRLPMQLPRLKSFQSSLHPSALSFDDDAKVTTSPPGAVIGQRAKSHETNGFFSYTNALQLGNTMIVPSYRPDYFDLERGGSDPLRVRVRRGRTYAHRVLGHLVYEVNTVLMASREEGEGEERGVVMGYDEYAGATYSALGFRVLRYDAYFTALNGGATHCTTMGVPEGAFCSDHAAEDRECCRSSVEWERLQTMIDYFEGTAWRADGEKRGGRVKFVEPYIAEMKARLAEVNNELSTCGARAIASPDLASWALATATPENTTAPTLSPFSNPAPMDTPVSTYTATRIVSAAPAPSAPPVSAAAPVSDSPSVLSAAPITSQVPLVSAPPIFTAASVSSGPPISSGYPISIPGAAASAYSSIGIVIPSSPLFAVFPVPADTPARASDTPGMPDPGPGGVVGSDGRELPPPPPPKTRTEELIDALLNIPVRDEELHPLIGEIASIVDPNGAVTPENIGPKLGREKAATVALGLIRQIENSTIANVPIRPGGIFLPLGRSVESLKYLISSAAGFIQAAYPDYSEPEARDALLCRLISAALPYFSNAELYEAVLSIRKFDAALLFRCDASGAQLSSRVLPLLLWRIEDPELRSPELYMRAVHLLNEAVRFLPEGSPRAVQIMTAFNSEFLSALRIARGGRMMNEPLPRQSIENWLKLIASATAEVPADRRSRYAAAIEASGIVTSVRLLVASGASPEFFWACRALVALASGKLSDEMLAMISEDLLRLYFAAVEALPPPVAGGGPLSGESLHHMRIMNTVLAIAAANSDFLCIISERLSTIIRDAGFFELNKQIAAQALLNEISRPINTDEFGDITFGP